MSVRFSPLAVVIALAPGLFARTGAAAITAQPGARVSFTAIGPAGMRIVGTTADLGSSDDGQTVTVTVPLARLSTGIELRDKHMREKYLEVGTYPTAALTVPRASLALPAAGASRAADLQGTLTLHGQSHPVRFHYAASNDGSSYGVDAILHLNMHDYGITMPSYLGVSVKPDVDVDVHFTARDL